MTRRRLGQHFLSDPVILGRIIESAGLSPDALVVEIGPGHGRLTRMLCERVRRVIAIELDARLYERLKRDLTGFGNLELVYGDALEYAYENLPEFSVVANIPYYITTPILFRLIATRKNLKSMTLTVQREVADRIVAKPGGKDYGVLTLMVQYSMIPELCFTVPKEAFRPVPKVDSAVVRLVTRAVPPVTVADEELFFRIIRTAFSQRRKMIVNALKGIHSDAKKWFENAGIRPERRPETLSIDEYARLANVLRGT